MWMISEKDEEGSLWNLHILGKSLVWQVPDDCSNFCPLTFLSRETASEFYEAIRGRTLFPRKNPLEVNQKEISSHHDAS